MDRRAHWDRIYASSAPETLSWYQREPRVSLDLITRLAHPADAVLDVGGGASALAGQLLERGFRDLTVMDLARPALTAARGRLGPRARAIRWIIADVRRLPFRRHRFGVWHDRAVFHFLVTEADRRAYVSQVLHAVRPGGTVIVATFAEDGPTRCSGLEVCRYSAEGLHAAFGEPFQLREALREDHLTPTGRLQRFQYCVCTAGAPHPAALSPP